MLLKQIASRNIQRNMMTKGLKVKHALQTCVILALTIWMIYQIKLFIHSDEATVVIITNNTSLGHHTIVSSELSDRIKSVAAIDIKLLGRKALFPLQYEDKPGGNSEAGRNENYEMQLVSDDEEQEEEEREVDRMDDLIDEDDSNDEEEGVLDEDEINEWDKQIEEVESTKDDGTSNVVENENEIQTTML